MVYDLIVIGGGPAGYLASERAGHAGLKVLLFEERNIGGVCLNEGCIPSKALLYSAKIFDYAKTGQKYGVTFEGAKIDQATVIKRKAKVVKTLVSGVKMKLKKNHVEVIEASAVLDGKDSEGFKVVCEGNTYKAKRLLLATGSSPVMPPIEGLREQYKTGFVTTNREILELTEIPEKLVVVGGGVIGLEMASYYNSVGSEVTIIEMLDHIAGQTDKDMAKILMKNYKKKGIEFNLNSKVVKISSDAVMYENNGEIKEAKASKVLVSIGRSPNTRTLGLDTIAVETSKRGAILTDNKCRTNVAEVYAAGDVNGKSMLAHTAYREADVCINNILGKTDVMRYNAIPSVIYTNPEVASAGETEESAKEKGIDIDVANITMKFSGRYVAENEGGNGICKIIRNKKYNTIIGVSLIGNYASEVIYGASLMIETEMQIDEIKELVFPHPTVSEVIKEALFTF